MKKLFFVIIGLACIWGCSHPVETSSVAEQLSSKDSLVVQPQTTQIDSNSIRIKSEDSKQENKGAKLTSDLELKVFKNDPPLEGYGYDILKDHHLYVHQPHIPAIPGNRGFSSEAFARKTAELVIHKIKNNIMPPSVDVGELDSLGVLK